MTPGIRKEVNAVLVAVFHLFRQKLESLILKNM